MNEKKKLCPQCQTGADSYKLDSKSPCCPYMGLHNGETCSKFKQLEEKPEKTYVPEERF